MDGEYAKITKCESIGNVVRYTAKSNGRTKFFYDDDKSTLHTGGLNEPWSCPLGKCIIAEYYQYNCDNYFNCKAESMSFTDIAGCI